MGLPIAVGLIVTPMYISYVGASRYGVLSLVWVLLGYFGFLDFGLSRATANALAKLTLGSAERGRILMTALYINLSLGLIGGLLLYFVGDQLLSHVLTLSNSLGKELENSFPWIACTLPLALIAGVNIGALELREEFLIINAFELIGGLLVQILPIACAAVFGPSLTVVIPAAFVARAVSVGLALAYVFRTEKPNLRTFDRTRFKELFGFGAWISVTNVIGPLLMSIDRWLIASMLGAASVAYYSVPMNLAIRSQMVATALAGSYSLAFRG